MPWTREGNRLRHDDGMLVEFEPIEAGRREGFVSVHSVEVEYQGRRWRGTKLRGVRKDRSGHDEMRRLQEARDEFLRCLRAEVNPFPAES